MSPRLDLELDRAYSRLVLAEVYRAEGNTRQAERLVGELSELWDGADAGFRGQRRLDAPVGSGGAQALW